MDTRPGPLVTRHWSPWKTRRVLTKTRWHLQDRCTLTTRTRKEWMNWKEKKRGREGRMGERKEGRDKRRRGEERKKKKKRRNEKKNHLYLLWFVTDISPSTLCLFYRFRNYLYLTFCMINKLIIYYTRMILLTLNQEPSDTTNTLSDYRINCPALLIKIIKHLLLLSFCNHSIYRNYLLNYIVIT